MLLIIITKLVLHFDAFIIRSLWHLFRVQSVEAAHLLDVFSYVWVLHVAVVEPMDFV